MFIGKKLSPWLGFVLVAGAAVIFVAALILGADVWCRSDINGRLPFYPGATLLSAEHDFLRLRAVGETTMTFSTDDSPEVVREWFRQLNLDLLERAKLRGLADIDRRFEANPEGEGTLIYYRSRCGL